MDINDDSIDFFLRTSKKIKKLVLNGCNITSNIFVTLYQNSSQLESLHINGVLSLEVIDDDDNDFEEEDFRPHNFTFDYISSLPIPNIMPSLKELTLSYVVIPIDIFKCIINKFPLKTLTLSEKTIITNFFDLDETTIWNDITNNIDNITLQKCVLPNMQDFIIKTKPTELHLNNVDCSVTNIRNILNNLKFKVIDIVHTELLPQDITLISDTQFDTLESLTLMYCIKISPFPILPLGKFEKLKALNFRDCGIITSIDLFRFCISCPVLQDLKISVNENHYSSRMSQINNAYKNTNISAQLDLSDLYNTCNFITCIMIICRFPSFVIQKVKLDMMKYGISEINKEHKSNLDFPIDMSTRGLHGALDEISPNLTGFTCLGLFVMCPNLNKITGLGKHFLSMNYVNYLCEMIKPKYISYIRTIFNKFIFSEQDESIIKMDVIMEMTVSSFSRFCNDGVVPPLENIVKIFRQYYGKKVGESFCDLNIYSDSNVFRNVRTGTINISFEKKENWKIFNIKFSDNFRSLITTYKNNQMKLLTKRKEPHTSFTDHQNKSKLLMTESKTALPSESASLKSIEEKSEEKTKQPSLDKKLNVKRTVGLVTKKSGVHSYSNNGTFPRFSKCWYCFNVYNYLVRDYLTTEDISVI